MYLILNFIHTYLHVLCSAGIYPLVTISKGADPPPEACKHRAVCSAGKLGGVNHLFNKQIPHGIYKL